MDPPPADTDTRTPTRPFRDRFARLIALRQRRWMAVVAPAAFFFLIALSAEIAAVRSAYAFGLWLREPGIIVLNIALMGLLTLFFTVLTNRFRAACLMTLAVALVLSVAHWMKTGILGVALYPWDLALVGETANVIEFGVLLGYWPNLLVLVGLLPVMVVAWMLLPRGKRTRMPLRYRLAGGVLCLACFASWFSRPYSIYRPIHEYILDLSWTQNESYARAGVLLAFTAHIQDLDVPEPADYSEQAVLDSAGPPNRTAQGEPETPVNVILILGESVWDVTKLEKVTFGSDPIPTIRRLGERFGRLDLVAPVFGGGTCDSELEVLTGCNMAFFPPETTPYKYYIRQPIPSLASTLYNAGYRTIAQHGVEQSYFNDCQVQPLLGFEVFHAAPLWRDIRKQGYYISDACTYAETIRLIDDIKAADPAKPFFISVNTMETHWPYTDEPHLYANRTETANFTAPPGTLSSDQQAFLETYVCSLRAADRALATFIEHFKTVDTRPTLIVFYGDHLPSLGADYAIYRRTGFYRDPTSNPLHFKTIFAVFWSNCGLSLPPDEPRRQSMCYLTPLILRMLGRPLPPFFRFLEKCKRTYPVFSVSGCIDSGGQMIPLADVLASDLARDYEMLQYDRVFGEQYFRRLPLTDVPPSASQNPFH